MRDNLTEDLFPSVSKEEREDRLKDPQRYASNVEKHMEEFGKIDGIAYLSDTDKKSIKEMLSNLIDCAKKEKEIREHWNVIYPVFLATSMSWARKSKELKTNV